MSRPSEEVYLLRCNVGSNVVPFDVYRDAAATAVKEARIGFPDSGTVLLKPNATVLFKPEKRIVTHPGFLTGMVDGILGAGVDAQRVVIADGQSGEQKDAGQTWEGSGYRAAADSMNVSLKALNGLPSRTVQVLNGEVFDQYPIYEEVTDSSFFFNVPLAKCHNLGCTTLSIKNLMGILARPERHLCTVQEVDKPFEDGIWRLTETGFSLFEDRFHQKLCDLLVAFRSLEIPRLTVVDGLVGRDGTAFSEGENYPLGWVLVGENEVHVDAVGTYLMGLDPGMTPYLQFAERRGLGNSRIEDIEVRDLRSGDRIGKTDLNTIRSQRVLMPICKYEAGYYDRFRKDGSVVPWRIDEVNKQRKVDGLDPIPVQ